MSDLTFPQAIVVSLIALGLFLALRAVVLWYWKLDRVVALLEQISAKLDGGVRPPLP